MTNRIALVIQYDGSGFRGWQNQKDSITVQGTLEEKIAELDPIRPVKAIAAGRTDSGVHASGQVVHFDCSGPIPIHKWASALNGRLPASIKVLEAARVANDWHACYSAKFRRYRYSIFNGSYPNLFLQNISWHKYRWKKGLRSEVKEAAPAHGLCLIRVGYEEKIFSKEKSFDTFPSFSLPIF